MTPSELQANIHVWRAKCLDNTITKEELIEALNALRGQRRSAAAQTPSKRTAKAKAAIPTAEDMLSELGLEPEKDDE